MLNQRLDDDKWRVTELVIAAQRGDREAFGQLFERFENAIMAIARRRMGDEGEAQELCQDVFIQAMLKLDQLRVPECFGGWLRAIAQRMAVNRLMRRRVLTVTDAEILDGNASDCDTPLAYVLADERRTQLLDGLKQLGEMDRKTLTAFYMEGRSLLEMSDDFQAPLGTIKRRLHMARKRLAKQVDALVAV